MSYFAKIELGKVVNIIIADAEWIATQPDKYKQYDETIPAGIGFIYDEVLDLIYPPKCHDEATLNDKCRWDCSNSEHEIKLNETLA
jgi:hypothetical protein